jgi:zinc protease
MIMKYIKTLVAVFTAFCLYITTATGQDLSKPAPADPDIRSGKLDNGLTYYIRHNKEPEKRASFYIIQNVGAILENDDQNGLAHFLEHMAFNGTEHFPGKAIISSLEKHGVGFGSNINAYTWFDETVYNLSDIPVDKPGLIDTCLLILNDWSDFISLTDKEIDLERGVIEEEWRTYKNADMRMFFKVIQVVMKGSKYAVRDVIGDPEVIRNFSYNTLRSFYHDWYRTDLQAIAVVGDINVDEVESKIKALFSKIPPVSNPPLRYYSEIPWHKETWFVSATDKEASQTSVSVIALHKSVPPENKNLKYVRDNYVISLMNSMISSRISELLQKPDPPFINGSIYFGSYYAKGYDAFTISASARQNEQALALEAVYSEAERARRSGFGKNELDRAKARMITYFENVYKQKDKIDNDTYVQGIQEHFLNGEPLTSIDFDFEFLKQVIDGITPEEVSERYRELMIDENRTIIIQGLEAENARHLTEKEALDLIDKVKNSRLEPFLDEVSGQTLIKEDLKGSGISRKVPLPEFGAIEYTLDNNVRVVYRKADYEKDNVILSAFSYGGISRLEDNLVRPASLLPTIVPMYGAGDYDNITLQKMLAGKNASVSFSLGETTEAINGSCAPKDFETMMQLLYLRLARPRFDKEAHNSVIQRLAAMQAQRENDPDRIKRDSISLITTGYHPRTVILTKENIESTSLEEIQKIYSDRFNGADEFIFFIVGNIEEDTVIKFVEKYLGSIPPARRKETWEDRDVEQPEGKITREIAMPLTIPKSTVFLSYSADMKYNAFNNLGLEVINGILDIVFIEKVREDEGGTYGVGVSLTSQKRPDESGRAIISFDCDPARAGDLKLIIYQEIDNLIRQGPDKINLDKTVNNILKNREENKMHNSYWSSVLRSYYVYDINIDDPANFEDILKSFTVRDIKKLAKKMFLKADLADIVFKPAE